MNTLLLPAPQIKKTLAQYCEAFVSEISRHYNHMTVKGFLFRTVEGNVILEDIVKTEAMEINSYIILENWYKDIELKKKFEELKIEKLQRIKDRHAAELAEKAKGNYTDYWSDDERTYTRIYENHIMVYEEYIFRGQRTISVLKDGKMEVVV